MLAIDLNRKYILVEVKTLFFLLLCRWFLTVLVSNVVRFRLFILAKFCEKYLMDINAVALWILHCSVMVAFSCFFAGKWQIQCLPINYNSSLIICFVFNEPFMLWSQVKYLENFLSTFTVKNLWFSMNCMCLKLMNVS